MLVMPTSLAVAGLGLEFGNGVGVAHALTSLGGDAGRVAAPCGKRLCCVADDLQLDRVGEVEDLLGRHDLERARARKRHLVDVGDAARPRRSSPRPGRTRKIASSIEWVMSTMVVLVSSQISSTSRFISSRVKRRARRTARPSAARTACRQRAHEGGALLHAARKLARKTPAEAFEADPVEQLIDPDPIGLGALDFEGKADVGVEIAPGQQVGLLEHHADFGVRPLHRLAVEQHLAGGQAMQARTSTTAAWSCRSRKGRRSRRSRQPRCRASSGRWPAGRPTGYCRPWWRPSP